MEAKMKKQLLLILFLFIFLIPIYSIRAEEAEYQVMKLADGTIMSYKTSTDDTLNFEKKIGEYAYRVTLNDHIGLNLDFSSKRVAFVKFFEGDSSYFFYGATYNDYDSGNTDCTPYILKLKKNLTYYDSYFDNREEIGGSAHFTRMVEFGATTLCLTEFVSGEYRAGTYTGLFQLRTFDEDHNELKSIDCGSEYATVTIAYDCFDVSSYGNHYYFHTDFNMLETYSKEEDVKSHFIINETCLVNGVEYKSGSVISEPGIYVLDDGIHEKKTITLNPEIELVGDKKGDYYKDYVEYKVSGGQIFINDELSYLNGTVSRPGYYKLKIKGVNGYTKEYDFIITPELYTNLEDGGTMSIGETLSFNGRAKLNGVDVKNGFKLSESGTYILELYAGEQLIKEIRFTVPQTAVQQNNSYIVYIVFIVILSITAISLLITYLIIRRNNKRRTK